MKGRNDYTDLGKIINQFALRLHQEVKIQKHFAQEKEINYHPRLQKISTKYITHEIKNIFAMEKTPFIIVEYNLYG